MANPSRDLTAFTGRINRGAKQKLDELARRNYRSLARQLEFLIDRAWEAEERQRELIAADPATAYRAGIIDEARP